MKGVHFLPVFLFLAPVGCENRKIELTEPGADAETSRPAAAETPQAEPAKEKAVRLAEDFIRRNGYTTAPADKENFSPETVEFYDSIDDLLKERYNTLDGKVYGVSPHGKGSRKGWTVVFRYSEKIRRELEKSTGGKPVSRPPLKGRAVTMDENFENLLIEHKDFFLDKVDRKF